MMRLISLALAAAVAAYAAIATAGGAAQAKEHFFFGVQAYEAGQYRAAVAAFEEAYRVQPHPGMLFSCGQALRRQYALDHRRDDLRRAIGYYRRYVEQVKQGGRFAEAAAALAELEPLASALGEEQPEELTAETPDQPKRQGVIMVWSKVKRAVATLDGGKPVAMPLSATVEPGKHKLTITAEGYVTEEQDVMVAPGGSYAAQIPLVAKPARLTIDGPNGAEIFVDGRSVGELPTSAALEPAAGRRQVAVMRNGYQPFVTGIDLERGRARSLEVELVPTGQRYASYVSFAVGAGGVVAGAVLAGLAFTEQSEANRILDLRAAQNISEDDRLRYERAVTSRDDFRRASVIAFAGGATVGALGLVLYIFDEPKLDLPQQRPEQEDAPAAPSSIDTLELSALPGADVGLSLSLRTRGAW